MRVESESSFAQKIGVTLRRLDGDRWINFLGVVIVSLE